MESGQGNPSSEIKKVVDETESLLKKLAETWEEDVVCYPFLLVGENITAKTVDKVFDDLQDFDDLETNSGRLVVLVDSGGGDIDAAYNLACLFRIYGKNQLVFVVPRWAKSAATLLVFGGDSVMMTPVAELGPLDPQITQVNPLEQRLEQFSPLDIESTLGLIRSEFEDGNKELAEGLLQRLQFPITLGRFKKSLEIGEQYASRLLSSRMLAKQTELASEIAKKMVSDYADHGFCLNKEEASSLGLNVEELSPSQLKYVWEIHKLARKKAEIESAEQEKAMAERLKELPPNILDGLPSELKKTLPINSSAGATL